MKPTDEQQTILNTYGGEKGNLLVRARAGAGKTASIKMLVNSTPSRSLYLAFNRSVVNEIKPQVPDRCDVKTLNGIGHRALCMGGRVELVRNKMFMIMKDKEYRGKDFAEVLRAAKMSKHAGWVPGHARSIMDRTQFFDYIDMQFPHHIEDLIEQIVARSWEMATIERVIDFDDQILVPTLQRSNFQEFPVVFVDEAQDLSPINHHMLKHIVGYGNKCVAVGDEAQAIYAFRGADMESMESMKARFKMSETKLTMTFRCSQAVTEEANWRTGDLRCLPDAPAGEVRQSGPVHMSDLQPDTAILCRNNAPLLSLAVNMITQGYSPRLAGNDILESIIKDMTKVLKPNATQAEMHNAVDAWEQEKLKVWKSNNVVEDRADCMRVFVNDAATGRDALAKARALANMTGRVPLSTIHKAKGNEWDHVVILDRHLIRFSGGEQEKNLMYVAQTRARHTLTYAQSNEIIL